MANHRSKSTSNAADCASETHSQPVDALPDAGRLSDTAVSYGPTRSESQAIAHSHEQEVVKKVCLLLPLCIIACLPKLLQVEKHFLMLFFFLQS